MPKLGLIIISCSLLLSCQPDTQVPTGVPCNFTYNEIVISELMVNPVTGSEWLELYNTTQRNIQLQRAFISVQGSGNARTIPINQDLNLAPGEYITVSSDVQQSSDYILDSPLRLPNTSGIIKLQCEANVAYEIHYDTGLLQFEAEAGVSFYLDGAIRFPYTPQTDDWCSGEATPGEANFYCGVKRCVDNGIINDLVAQDGIIISEVFSDAAGVDTGHEWIELYNSSPEPRFINGIVIEDRTANSHRDWIVANSQCLILAADNYYVIGFNGNNKSFVDIQAQGNQDLFNANATLRLYQQGSLIDYADTPDFVQDKSFSLNPALLNGIDNDSANNYCLASSNGISGEPLVFATPGMVNDACP